MKTSYSNESLKELQDYLMNIDSLNIEETKKIIIESFLSNGVDFYSAFYRTFLIALMYRPCETELYIKLISDIFLFYKLDATKKDLDHKLFETVFHLPGPTIAGLFVLYRLYESDLVCINDIIQCIRLFHFQNADMKINLTYCYLWFAPEMSLEHKYILTLLKSDFDEFVKNNPVHLFLKNFQIDLLFADNFKLLKNYRKSGHNHFYLTSILLNDDIESLQKITVDPKFNYDQTIQPSFFEICPFIQNEPTLIDVSAFFGSIKCFKYFLLNGSNLLIPDNSNEILPHFAIAGGNVEIIRICNQKKLNLAGTPQIASLFHRNNIIDWLIEGECQEIGDYTKNNGTIIQNAAVTNNLNAIEMCLEQKVDVNEGNMKKTSLQSACENGNIESVILLLTSKDIDINACVLKNILCIYRVFFSNLFIGFQTFIFF